MYIAVKGGEAAIDASRRLLTRARRGDPALPALEVAQVRAQLGLAVDRVMAEASLFDPELAALALVQAQGDAIEAAFLLRAYRTTLPRFGASEPLDTDRLRAQRRVSAIFKDLPGGQVLGPTADYTQRLLDFARLRGDSDLVALTEDPTLCALADQAAPATGAQAIDELPNALQALAGEGLVEPCRPAPDDPVPTDITRDPPRYPLSRAGRLQMLARADEGWVLGMGYATQRGYAHSHPFAGDIRQGALSLSVQPDELPFAIEIGEIAVTECQMLNQFVGECRVRRRSSRAATGWCWAMPNARPWPWPWWTARCVHDDFGESPESPPRQHAGICAAAWRRHRSLGLRAAPQAAALRDLRVRTADGAPAARRTGRPRCRRSG